MRRPRRKAAPLAIVVVALLVWLARGPLKEVFEPKPSGEWRVVVRVIDGDTLELDGGERIRLIGVDTPESLEDGTFLNAEILRQGYGHAYTRFPFRYADEFRAYEREARENRRGLWAQ